MRPMAWLVVGLTGFAACRTPDRLSVRPVPPPGAAPAVDTGTTGDTGGLRPVRSRDLDLRFTVPAPSAARAQSYGTVWTAQAPYALGGGDHLWLTVGGDRTEYAPIAGGPSYEAWLPAGVLHPGQGVAVELERPDLPVPARFELVVPSASIDAVQGPETTATGPVSAAIDPIALRWSTSAPTDVSVSLTGPCLAASWWHLVEGDDGLELSPGTLRPAGPCRVIAEVTPVDVAPVPEGVGAGTVWAAGTPRATASFDLVP